MKIYQEFRSIVELADFLNWNVKGVQNTIDLGRWIPADHAVKGGGATRKARLFGFCSILHMSMARSLVSETVGQKAAFEMTRSAAYTGEVTFDEPSNRHPGFPVEEKHGETFLAISSGRTWIGPLHTECPGRAFEDMRSHLGGQHGGHSIDTIMLVSLNRHFERVCRWMGYDPHDVLEEAYGVNLTEPA